MATDPREIIEPILVDGIESEPGVRMRLRWPALTDKIVDALRHAGLLASTGSSDTTGGGS